MICNVPIFRAYKNVMSPPTARGIQLGRGPSSKASKDPAMFPVKSGDPEIMSKG